MIILSVGLQKSGSGLLFNLTNDMLIRGGYNDIREIRDKYSLTDFVKYYNCNIGEPTLDKIQRLTEISLSGHTFVVKTHAGINQHLIESINQNQLKATVIFRDPRDVVISAMDHGKKIRDNKENHTFSIYTNLEITIKSVIDWLNTIITWFELESTNILKMRYEDLIMKPEKELANLNDFLGTNINSDYQLSIFKRYDAPNLDVFAKDYLHFNEGKIGRYKSTLTNDEINQCNHAFDKYLPLLGYNL